MGHFCIVFHDYGAVRWQGKSGVTWCSYSSHAQMNNSIALFVCYRLNAHWVRALLVGRAGAPPISVLNFHEACSSKLDAVHSPQACALIVLSSPNHIYNRILSLLHFLSSHLKESRW